MKEYTAVILLFLAINSSFSNGHALSKIEMNNVTVYEVKENESALSIAHPKDDKPTLRDIVYYHIIEKPYYTYDSNDEDDNEQPDDYQNDPSELDDDDDDDKTVKTTEANHHSTDKSELMPAIDKRNGIDEVEKVAKSLMPVNDDDDDADKPANVDIDKNKDELSVTQEVPKSRSKREINNSNIPDAPTLPEFNLDSLPDYIKAVFMMDADNSKSKQADILENEIDKKVSKLEEAVNYNHPPAHKGSNNGSTRKAKTYGMSLAGDNGVVWNNVSVPHLEYHVGEPEIVPSTTSKPKEHTTIRTTTTENPIDDTFYEDNYFIEAEDENNRNLNSDELIDIEASFNEINKMLDQLIKENEGITEDDDDVTETPDENNDKTNTDTSGKDKTHDSSTEKTKLEGKKDMNDKKNNNKEMSKDRNEDSKQKEFVKELMKNKYFWQWLQDSSTAYLGVVMKKLDVLIKEEVAKQIKTYFEEHKNVSNNIPNKINATENTTSEKPIQSNNVTDVDDNTTQKPNVTSTELNVPSNNTTDKEPSNNGSKTEDLANKDNNKESDANNKENSVRIKAKNIYGNSVGNDKVTNIFIFNISKDTDLANLKPISNGTDGVFVFGLDDKKPDQHKDDDTTENDKDIAKPVTSTENPEKPIDDTIESTTSNSISETTENEHKTPEKPKPTNLKPNNDKDSTTSATETAEETTTEPANEPSKDQSNKESDTTTPKPNDNKESTTIDKVEETTTEATKEPIEDLNDKDSIATTLKPNGDDQSSDKTTEAEEPTTEATKEPTEDLNDKDSSATTLKPNGDDQSSDKTTEAEENTKEPTEDLNDKDSSATTLKPNGDDQSSDKTTEAEETTTEANTELTEDLNDKDSSATSLKPNGDDQSSDKTTEAEETTTEANKELSKDLSAENTTENQKGKTTAKPNDE